MKIEEINIKLNGRPLHRLILHPAKPPRGTLVFFHGQGDFVDRYPPILSPFVDAGYRCILTDLPGHGRSGGSRGAVPGLKFVDQLLEDSLQGQPEPYLVAGHSMGGLLALRFFLAHPDRFEAAWFSSPLLDPMRQAKPLLRTILPLVAHIAPWVTVSTGVRSEDCTDESDERPDDATSVLYHSRISLGWGRNLGEIANTVAEQFPAFPAKPPILFTQGELDYICPAGILTARLAKLSSNQITYREIAEARHEPFSGSTLNDFLRELKEWVSGLSQTPLR